MSLEELRQFSFNWKPANRPQKNKSKWYNRNKEILEQRTPEEISEDIWETIGDLIDRINPTNNSRLGAILLTLEGARGIGNHFHSQNLEFDKQRPQRIPPHILTKVEKGNPDLTGQALLKECIKQRDIYNEFLENTQTQLSGIKKRIILEVPEFCKIIEEESESETESGREDQILTNRRIVSYGDYDHQFTILPFNFKNQILHHLEAIDNILFCEGARNTYLFEEEEHHGSLQSEVKRLQLEKEAQERNLLRIEKVEQRLNELIKRPFNHPKERRNSI